jgi:hypothetical protein
MKTHIFCELPAVVLMALASLAGPAQADTVTFQQGINGYSGTSDTWLGYNDYTENFGNDWDIHVRHDAYATVDDRVTLIRFNLSSLPAHAVITSASLSLLYYDDYNISSSDYLTVSAYRLLKPWTAGTGGKDNGRTGASWYYQYAYPDTTQWYNGGARGIEQDRRTSPDASVTLYDINGSYAWTTFSGSSMTASVANWYANPSQNFGWVLDYSAYSDSMDGAIFHSSDYSTSPADYVWRPKLQIDYTIVPEPGSLAMLAGLTMTVLLYRRRKRAQPFILLQTPGGP